MYICTRVSVICLAIMVLHFTSGENITETLPTNIDINKNATGILSMLDRIQKKSLRSVLIINKGELLRSKTKKIESLRYEEYDDNGKRINVFTMYNLKDVSVFFKVYLNTEICHGKCDTD